MTKTTEFAKQENLNVHLAEIEAASNDFFYLLKHAADYAAQREETAAAVLVKKALAVAVYSSDFLDVAEMLCRFYRLKDYFSVKSCLQKARNAAKIYCDFAEIEKFEAQYQF